MDDDYRSIADQFDQSFLWLSLRKAIEEFSIMKLLGPLEGRSVLDLATGTGHYSRAVKRLGARRAVGVDISAEMIRVAREQEARAPLGVEYVVQDVAELDLGGTFDLVLGAYLLHYARSREHLDRMCQAIGRHLAPGGRFVTFQLNPDVCREPGFYEPFGVRIHPPAQPEDGRVCPFSIRLGEDTWSPEITAYYWTWPTLVASLNAAGLTGVRSIELSITEDAVKRDGMDWWAPCLTKPHMLLMEAVKGEARGSA